MNYAACDWLIPHTPPFRLPSFTQSSRLIKGDEPMYAEKQDCESARMLKINRKQAITT